MIMQETKMSWEDQIVKYVCKHCGEIHVIVVRQECYYEEMFNDTNNNKE